MSNKPFPENYLYSAMRHVERNCDFELNEEERAAVDAGELQETDFRHNDLQVKQAAYGPPMHDLLKRMVAEYDTEDGDFAAMLEEARALLAKVEP